MAQHREEAAKALEAAEEMARELERAQHKPAVQPAAPEPEEEVSG